MICARSPGAATQRSCRLGGSAVIKGEGASGSPRLHVFGVAPIAGAGTVGFGVKLFARPPHRSSAIFWRFVISLYSIISSAPGQLPRRSLLPSSGGIAPASSGSRPGSQPPPERRSGSTFRFVPGVIKKQIKLVGVQLLARAAEHAPDEQVHLLTKQLDFLTKTSVLFAQLLILFKKLLFAQFLHCLYMQARYMPKSKQ